MGGDGGAIMIFSFFGEGFASGPVSSRRKQCRLYYLHEASKLSYHLRMPGVAAHVGSLWAPKGGYVLRISPAFDLEAFESGLIAIANGEKELQLPNSIKSNAVGASAALIQLIITWSRRSDKEGRLRLYAKNENDPSLQNFARTSFGLIALNMAHNIELVSGLPISRKDALERARDFVVAMHSLPVSKIREISKSTIPFICMDNAAEYGRPTRLYIPGTEEVRDRKDFESLLISCCEELPIGRILDRERYIEPAASLIYEAFHNTDDHARTNFKKERIRRSVRGILIGYHHIALSGLARSTGNHKPLQQYFADWRPDRENAKHAQFLEISIFDSGSGLAQRWLGLKDRLKNGILEDGVGIREEYEAVSECLRKRASTIEDETKGNGLFRIMQVVKKCGGFIRVRSGRLSLIKAFKANPLAGVSDHDLAMEDMNAGRKPSFEHKRLYDRAWAEGTVITAMLPLNRGLQQ